ncbi:MAG TPA: hypothetical protein VNU97_00795 [Rhizomicrobium sp.]|nr:hypothetical protein [Rhizomicrobium sp.]
MSLSKLPVWSAVLFLAGATFAYGQATQAPDPGGHVPPTTTTTQPGPTGPGPSPQGGTTTGTQAGH